LYFKEKNHTKITQIQIYLIFITERRSYKSRSPAYPIVPVANQISILGSKPPF
jgi:hypothetical protein